MVRNHTIDQAHGRKLDAKWSHPKFLVRINKSRQTVEVYDLYGDNYCKKEHLNNLKVYCPREGSKYSRPPQNQIERSAMAMADRHGMRAVDLRFDAHDF